MQRARSAFFMLRAAGTGTIWPGEYVKGNQCLVFPFERPGMMQKSPILDCGKNFSSRKHLSRFTVCSRDRFSSVRRNAAPENDAAIVSVRISLHDDVFSMSASDLAT
jgi:hypothetical protein